MFTFMETLHPHTFSTTVMSWKADMKKEVVKCLINLIHKHGGWIDNDGSIFLACDTILNASEGLQKKCIYKSRFAMHECYTKHGKEVESCLPSYANINNVVKIGSAVGGNYFSS
ncbi:uncharacterized protein LOC103503025 [Cucumis melo]|uniref:Uncharacterized protein LOC103503025 n=1 Tax=Cucumis melo TaxID=3656 RepID=A0A1S3CQA2_CUCME|nr:uncharacterized protein LOC103503025 [Cucumis melo]